MSDLKTLKDLIGYFGETDSKENFQYVDWNGTIVLVHDLHEQALNHIKELSEGNMDAMTFYENNGAIKWIKKFFDIKDEELNG